MVQSEEYIAKQKAIAKSRLVIARKWVLIVLTYYVARAAFIIFPLFNEETTRQQVFEIIQFFMGICISCAIGLTFYNPSRLELIKYVLFF